MLTLRKRVSAALKGRGFRGKGGAHLQRLDGDFSFWVGVGPIGWQRDIAPAAGIRSERVEALVTELMALPSDPWHPTAGANVGYLLGDEYRAWLPGAEVEDIVSTISSALERLRPLADLSQLPRAFAMRGVAELPHRWYALTTIALLAKDPAQVRYCLAKAQREFCERPDEVCEQFRAFEARALHSLEAMDSR